MRRTHTTHTRDAALRQLKRINRWLIAGSVVLTGVLADVAANAFPGKTSKNASASSKKASKPHAKHTGGTSKTTTGVLHPPKQAPQASSEAESAPTEPAQEAPPQESSAPAQEAPVEAAPQQESAPAPEAAPSQEAAPEEPGPVVSGGS
jgi:hypothetical protein